MIDDGANLRIPGPTPLPPAVRAALSRQMINHRSRDYAAIQQEVVAGLRHFFQTEHDVVLFAGSGTGGLEAAIVNVLSPGDHVLAVSIGVFGDRFARIAEAYGAIVHRLDVEWGHAARAEAVGAAAEQIEDLRAVLLTCNETSTAVMNDIPALATAVRAATSSALLIVDAISALGAVDLPMDALGLDVLVTGSQKAWMSPPGMTMLGVSPRAWQAHRQARMPRFYWDFTTQRKAQEKGQDAWTPAITTMYGMQVALQQMQREGLPAIVNRHERIARQVQRGLTALGIELFAEKNYRSRTVTAGIIPEGIDGEALLRHAESVHEVVFNGGQAGLAGKIIRIGHMGWVEDAHIEAALSALGQSLAAVGGRRTAPAGST